MLGKIFISSESKGKKRYWRQPGKRGALWETLTEAAFLGPSVFPCLFPHILPVCSWPMLGSWGNKSLKCIWPHSFYCCDLPSTRKAITTSQNQFALRKLLVWSFQFLLSWDVPKMSTQCIDQFFNTVVYFSICILWPQKTQIMFICEYDRVKFIFKSFRETFIILEKSQKRLL